MPGPEERAADGPLPLTELTEDERLLRDSVRAFARSSVAPLVAEMDATAHMPRALIEQLFGLGLMGILAPETVGGGGGRFFHAVLAVEELSRIDPSVGLLVDVQNTLVISAIRRFAAPEPRDRLLRALSTDTVGAFALSETGAGSDAFALQTRAEADGDTFVLRGQKQWITNASEAGLFIVFATVDPALGRRGVTAFVVDRDTPGLVVGRKEDKLGIRASSTCEVLLEGCRVARERLLGTVGEGGNVALATLNEGRVGIGAQMVGLAAGALDLTIRHTHARRQFGRPVAEFQGVQFQLARAAADLEAARLLVYNAARRIDAGQPVVLEGAMAKLIASETAERIASLAVNLHGGTGFVRDSPVEKFYRDAKIGQIYEGTTNLLLQTIAKHLG
jgi:alkylation response protein AidB-like acyl-CoA dehydrogenase